MSEKLHLDLDLNNLTEKDKKKFLELVEKANVSDVEKPFNPFERVEKGEKYYIITDGGEVDDMYECNDYMDDEGIYKDFNYYNDKDFAKHQALRELLNRKLIKFSYENDGADIDYIPDGYSIVVRNYSDDIEFEIDQNDPDILAPVFVSYSIAKRAIDEVIKPFMEEHPDFKFWG